MPILSAITDKKSRESLQLSFAITENFCYGFSQEVSMAKLDMGLLAERLRTAREHQGLSQTALAERAELNIGNVNELEHQRKPGVRADTILALAEALHVSADYLLGRSDDPTPPKRRRPRTTAPVG
jgi:DNA-binding Xre family transcriptional regulator